MSTFNDLISRNFILNVLSPCSILGVSSFNSYELIPHGYVWPSILRINENGELERIKQLPADRALIQIKYTKITQSDNTSLGQLGSGNPIAAFGAGAGAVLAGVALQRATGGQSRGTSQFIFDLMNAYTVINREITITQEHLDNWYIDLPFYIVSVFAVTKKKIILNDEQRRNFGINENTRSRGLSGSNLDRGQHDQDLQLEDLIDENDISFTNDDNIFLSILFDDRKLSFRSDFISNDYGFSTQTKNDCTNKNMLIDMSNLAVGDSIYFSGLVATDLYTRNTISHFTLIQEFTSAITKVFADISVLNNIVKTSFYSLKEWKVPKNLNTPIFTPNSTEEFDIIEGWRISEISDYELKEIFIGDSRGIFKADNKGNQIGSILVGGQYLQQFDWWNEYLLENSIIDFNGNTVQGALFDVSEICNQLIVDNLKIPYYRPLALVLQKVEEEIGSPNLDFVNLATTNVPDYDLKDVNFDFMEKSSFRASTGAFNTGGYGVQNCPAVNGSNFLDPNDPLNRLTFIIFPPVGGDVVTDWVMTTPYFYRNFSSNFRIYTEYYKSAETPFAKRGSQIFTITRPISSYSLSTDIDPYKNEAISIFPYSDDSSINYHLFKDLSIGYQNSKLDFNIDNNHNRFEEVDFNRDLYHSYNKMTGNVPSYSNGKPITIESQLFYFFSEVSDLIEDNSLRDIYLEQYSSFDSASFYQIDDVLSQFQQSQDYSIELDSEKRISFIEISYKNDFVEDNIYTSLELISSSGFKVIDNRGLINNREGIIEDDIDCAFYKANKIIFHGDLIRHLKDNNLISSLKVYSVSDENFDLVKIENTNMSVVVDGKRRIIVFYEDSETGNISCAVSYNFGVTWFRYRDLIIKSSLELLSEPYAIVNKKTNIISLFYNLNNSFLMNKEFDSDLFNISDSLYKMEEIETIDFSESFLDMFAGLSDQGIAIRMAKSEFVHGRIDNYYENQQSVSQQRESLNFFTYYNFVNPTTDFDDVFSNYLYSIFSDNKGIKYVAFIKDDLLYIKKRISDSYWKYIIKDCVVHKNLYTEEDPSVISSFSVYSNTDSGQIVFSYATEGRIFYRIIPMNIFSSVSFDNIQLFFDNWLSKNDEDNDEYINRLGKPIFLVGELTVEDINNINTSNEDLTFEYPYTLQNPETFDSSMSIDETARPLVFFTASNLIKILYLSTEGYMYGATLYPNPELDVRKSNGLI